MTEINGKDENARLSGALDKTEDVRLSGTLDKADYVEPACVLCGTPYGQEEKKPVPIGRILTKMDEYMGRQDFEGARRHLAYWLEEARLNRDLEGQFSLHNELMGFHRKMREKAYAFEHAEAALSLIDRLDMADSVSAATACVNAATVYGAFDEPERSMPLFERARALYEKYLPPTDGRLGGLYNNMGLTLTALGRYDEALSVYNEALSVMEKVPGGVLEMAITYLNMADTEADAFEARELCEEGLHEDQNDAADIGSLIDEIQDTTTDTDLQTDEIQSSEADIGLRLGELLEKAQTCLEDPSPARDGYYAFVVEKCAPVFSYYGWEEYGDELAARAEAIYKENQAR